MESMPISVFKATCLAVLERIRRSGRPVLVTRRGVPIAQVLPPPPPERPPGGFGSMEGEEIGDIVEPLPAEEWEALR